MKNIKCVYAICKMASIVIYYSNLTTSQIGLPEQTGCKVNVLKTTIDRRRKKERKKNKKKTFRAQIQLANKYFELIYNDFIYLPVGH